MKKIFFCFLVFFNLTAFSQTGNLVFNDTLLHNLVIQTSLQDWFYTLDQDYQQNVANPTLYPQIYHSCDVTWDGIALPNCGFREKGNASNSLNNFGKKKPLKIAFDEFVNQNLDGLKTINLNNFTNDPSLLHDVICFKLMRDAGIIAPRTAYTKLWVNGEYIGLYLVIENVDKTFLKFAYGGGANNDGNLYKTDRGAHVFLNWLGSSSAGYEGQGLKLTTNDSIGDWSKLISFIDFINNNHDADFRQQFENRFDVHTYIKILAIEKCVRSWDSYWGGGNNYYLYEHPDGKIRWIPWDMNETFQDIKIISGITTVLDGYLIPTPQIDARPLLKRIFEVDEWKTEYLNYACDLVQTKFTLDNLGKFILDRHNLIDDAYKTDNYRYNSYDAFQNSLTEYNQDAVSLTHSSFVIRINYPGIYPFIQSQREWVVEQIKAWDKKCSIDDNSLYNLSVFPNPTYDFVNISNSSTGFEYAKFKLYDFMGNLVMDTNYELMQGGYFTLPLQTIPGGIYLLLKVSADGKTGRAKVIVK